MTGEQRTGEPSLSFTTAAVLGSIERGMRHVLAEQTNELEPIMETIDRSPYFPLIDHDGHGGLALQFLTDTESVRNYYGARHGSYEVVASRPLAAVATEFYTFRESVAALRGVGDVGGVASGGAVFEVNSAVLFPTGPGGIGGEIVWTRYPFADVLTGSIEAPADGDGPTHLPNTRMRNGDHHDRYLDAWRAADTAAMVAEVADDARWLRRIRRDGVMSYLNTNGRADTEQALAAELAARRPQRIDILNRIVAEWYVFCDLAIETQDATTAAIERSRHIMLHPLDSEGRLRAELGDQQVISEQWRS